MAASMRLRFSRSWTWCRHLPYDDAKTAKELGGLATVNIMLYVEASFTSTLALFMA